MSDKIDKAFDDLMSAEHMTGGASQVLAEHMNDLQEEIERLTAEIVALKYSIKLITGMVPIDIHKYVAALEAYGVEVDDE